MTNAGAEPPAHTPVEVEVADGAWRREVPEAKAVVACAAAFPLVEKPGAEVVVLLTNDAAVAQMNLAFRGREGPTNVLSFPAPRSAWPHLGDIALALETCRTEASAQGKTLADHVRHLVVHGVLHLLGHDHEDEGEAEAMEALERRHLAAMGVGDPYAGGGT